MAVGKNAMVKRTWMRVPASLAALIGIGLAGGCRPSGHMEESAVVPVLELHGVKFRVYRGDRLTVSGDASSATLRRDTGAVTARDLDALLPSAQPVPVRVTAPRGQGDLDDRTFEVEGGVTATRADDVARTARARYEPGSGLVRGDDPVTVTGRSYRLDGTGFTLDPTVGELVLLKDARLDAETGGAL